MNEFGGFGAEAPLIDRLRPDGPFSSMGRRYAGGGLVALAAAVTLAGCGGGSSASMSSAGSSVAVRGCSMAGIGGLAADYRRRALIFGPLALGNLRSYTAQQPLPAALHGRRGAYEVIAIVSAGTTPVLSLPGSEWSTVGLLYDPSKFRDAGAYRLRNLDQMVGFKACRAPSFNHGVSRFDAAFVVTTKQCVRFIVTVPGGRTYRGEFPAAAPCKTRRLPDTAAMASSPRRELVAHLTHPLLRPGEACPVTRPNPRSYKPPKALRSILNGDLRGKYGHRPLAAILPVGRVSVTRDPHHGWYRTKVGWCVDVPGALHIAARRLDRRSAILGHGDIAPPAPTGAHRIEPTNVLMPAPGCWQVAGSVGREVSTWIFRARD